MNKDALLERMSQISDHPKSTCKDCLDAFVEAVTTALKRNEQVTIAGFGSFATIKRKGRTGVNPATGKKMTIPARRSPKFKPGKGLKDAVK